MDLIFSEEKTNLGRQKEFDYVKVISILFMVIIHVVEEMSRMDISVLPSTIGENILQFGAGPFAAPIFMIAMGLGMSYSSHRTPKELFNRGWKIFLMGYALNAFRDGFYCLIRFAHFGYWDFDEFMFLFFNGDILPFAGLSFMIIAGFKKMKMPVLSMAGMAVLFQLLGQYLASAFPVESNWCYLTGLFYYCEGCYFPFFNWFIYPCLGLVLAKYLRHINNPDKFYGAILGISATALVAFGVSLTWSGYDLRRIYGLANDIYYKQDFISLLFTMLSILVLISIIHFVIKAKFFDKIDSTVSYISRRLNTIYIIQWLLVGTGTFIVDMLEYEGLPVGWTIFTGFAFAILAFFICKGWEAFNKAIKKK